MIIVLPPSETKAPNGDGPALDFSSLSFPNLTEVRTEIATDLAALAPEEALNVLKISEKLIDQAVENTQVFSSPTMPAIFRYTGVLYDALQAETLSNEAKNKIAIGSALFGVVKANDMIPFYRLSGGSKLPHKGQDPKEAPTLKSRYAKEVTKALENENTLIVDLRSGAYQQLGKVKDAITVRVESVQPDGSRKVVSHFNKHYKGVLARKLASADVEPTSKQELIDLARELGFTIEEQSGSKARELILVV